MDAMKNGVPFLMGTKMILENAANSGSLLSGDRAYTPNLYESDAAALAGKNFPSNYFYVIGSSSVNSSSVNGVSTNNGSVSGFSASSLTGSVSVVNAVSGQIMIGSTPLTIMGSTSDGQYLVLGREVVQTIGSISFTSLSASYVLANNGQIPSGALNFSTNNNYTPPNPVCYVRGTKILTIDGYKPIEDLRVGDMVTTSSGLNMPVKWLGHRSLKCGLEGVAAEALPIRIRAGALGDQMPFEDLLVSPSHCIGFTLVDDILVPAGLLVNGSTVITEQADFVEYWHVELDGHALLNANGVNAESYRDVGNRQFFANADVVNLVTTHVGEIPGPIGGLSLIVDGDVLAAVRHMVNVRANKLGWHLVQSDAQVEMVSTGIRFGPDFKNEHIHVFRTYAPLDVIHLHSSVHVPALVNPASTDNRTLGFCLFGGEIVDADGCIRQIDVEQLDGPGFHRFESDETSNWRWTNGHAILPENVFAGLKAPLTIRLDIRDAQQLHWMCDQVAVAAAG